MENYNEYKNKIIKSKPQLQEKLTYEFKKLCDLLYKFSPYQVLSYLNLYFKKSLLGTETEYDVADDDVELKYTIELVQIILAGGDNKKHRYVTMKDEDFYEIIRLGNNIYRLKFQYILAITYELEDVEEENAQYIFESELSSAITGKRYDIFEVDHYKTLFAPIKEYFQSEYKFSIDDLCSGIDKLKKRFMYGFAEVVEDFEKIEKKNFTDITNYEKESIEKVVDKLLGLKLQNVGEIAEWPNEFLDILTLEKDKVRLLLDNITFEKLCNLHKMTNQKPLIKIGDSYYYLFIQRLLDNLDRIILKDLYKNEKIREKIKKIIANRTEELVGIYVKNIIPTANVLTTNFYKISKDFYENDVLITFGKVLFIIEVKSGSFSQDAALNNIQSHVNALKTLIEKADLQVTRFEENLIENVSLTIYNDNNKKAKKKLDINIEDYEEIFKIVVTLEGFNEIEARADKVGILNLNQDVIVCSLDDLKVYSDYFQNNPIQFLHYMKYRKLATRTKGIDLNDELDHLGLYIQYNRYPIVAEKLLGGPKNKGFIMWEEPRKELDRYYTGIYIDNERITEKPEQKLPERLLEIIRYVNNDLNFPNILIINTILDLDAKEKNILFGNLEICINHYTDTKKVKYAFFKNDVDNLSVITCIVNDNYIEANAYNDVYANMHITNSKKANILFLYYDTNKKLIDITHKILYIEDEKYNANEVLEVVKTLKEKRLQKRKQYSKKIGRNEPCPCGSGKKYKKCCGKNKE